MGTPFRLRCGAGKQRFCYFFFRFLAGFLALSFGRFFAALLGAALRAGRFLAAGFFRAGFFLAFAPAGLAAARAAIGFGTFVTISATGLLGGWAVRGSASLQPCASRTASMVARMSFQVCWFIKTELGNMHPSQQMWRTALVTFPLASRSQKRAWCGMLSLPLGSVARQWRPVLSCEPEPRTVASF